VDTLVLNVPETFRAESLALSPDSKTLLVGSTSDFHLAVVNTTTKATIRSFALGFDRPVRTAFAPSGLRGYATTVSDKLLVLY
jgi:hypothetical protein